MLLLYNTLTARKEQFVSLIPGKVSLYVCGITPYDYAHIGHGRSYVSFDVLFRLLSFLGYNVTYVRNFTDIDDKLLNKAEKLFGDKMRYQELARKYSDAYNNEMADFNCIEPAVQPRVTDHIPEIIAFIQGLVDAGKAYAVDGDVYFRLSSFPEYGKLSKQKIDALRAGARVDVNDKKEDPLDFALWKSEAEGTFWQSPWGFGRPGWHIECSALAKRYLGKQIDIHGGGADLIFPHHENEVAQSEALHNCFFARYWMHNGLVRIDQEKMSKSLGNVFMLKDMFAKVDPMVLRFYFLNHHYRAPLDFSFHELEIAHKNYQKLCKLFEAVPTVTLSESVKNDPYVKRMLEFLCDDVNTTGAMGVLFEYIKTMMGNETSAPAIKAFLMSVFGLRLQPLPEEETVYTPEITALLEERNQARAAKDWQRADALRDMLQKLGVDVQDSKIKKQ